MNIKILDSWLRDYLKTDAKPEKIAEVMSLTSVSIERLTKVGTDYLYDIEITTNRPDLMSVIGLAREANTILNQFGIHSELKLPTFKKPITTSSVELIINNDPALVHRICAVVMEVTQKNSPPYIKDRLESTDIRSLNNLIDITNYVMRVTGHPTHAFDYDRVIDSTVKIRESKKGEQIITLDGKKYILPGGDIIAEDGSGEIIDLLAIMGLENSVVTDTTKRIIFFIDNNDALRIRKTSMSLGIRTEAAQLEEKGVDPTIAMDALLYGIALYQEHAEGKVISDLIDIYPHPYKEKQITVSEEQIQTVIGVPISLKESETILRNLGFKTDIQGKSIEAIVPSIRANDVNIPEDLIEEIARVYGYHNIPSALPPIGTSTVGHYINDFYWEQRVKEALKYWGFSEVYTYSMVSENLFEGELSEAVTIQNPLTDDGIYMRKSLVPSLLQVVAENKSKEKIKIFELSNVYHKKAHDLPDEKLHLAGIIKTPKVSFFEAKGLFEQLGKDVGINNIEFKPIDSGTSGAELFIGSEKIGDIEILDAEIIDFEIDFHLFIKHASNKKVYVSLPKYPPIIEDMAFTISDVVSMGEILELIKKQSDLIKSVKLLDKYEDNRTFRITYQHAEKNLTSEDVAPIREKITKTLKEKLHISIKI